jgi:ZIP family zinc transporter
MENNFWTALATSTLAATVTSLGILTIRKYSAWGQRNIAYFICFAAGVLISASFLHIIPKSLSMNPQASRWLLVGFWGMHLSDHFLTAFVCQREVKNRDWALGIVPMLGIGFHSFLDGVIYSIAFTVSIFTGYLATLGMVLHEFPEGIITYLMLIRGGFSERSSSLLAFLAAAATTPLGMMVSYPLLGSLEQKTLGALLSFSAGALVYVGATHLLPRAMQEQKKFSLVALAGGVSVAVIIAVSHH